MLWLHVFLYLALVSISNGFIEHFLYNNTAPKCCEQDEVLRAAGSGKDIYYDCLQDKNRNLQLLVNEILPWNYSKATSCVDDFLVEKTEERYTVELNTDDYNLTQLNFDFFPKCCPVNSAYDMRGHKCVEISNDTETDFRTFTEEFLEEHLTRGLLYVKSGLDECKKVIADYELQFFDVANFDENKGFFVETLNETFSYGSYCVDKVYNSGNYVVRVCHRDFSICRRKFNESENIRCIRKCCPDGLAYRGGGKCVYDFENGLNFANDTRISNLGEAFAVVQGHDCTKYLVETSWNWNYTLDETGNLKLNLEKDQISHSPFEDSYCFEHTDFPKLEEFGTKLFLCFKEKDRDRIEFQISRITLIFSSIFLTLTILGYVLLPELQNLHGKTLICHCISLKIAFVCLLVIQFNPTWEGLAWYIIMYTFLSAFLWSNIMCFDIWRSFGCIRVKSVNQKKKELKRFLWYCLYAWSLPVVITGATFTTQQFGASLPKCLQPIVPRLGEFNCFFEPQTNTAAFLTWFSFPVGIITLCNLVLYIKTIFYYYKVKNDIEKREDSPSNNNERSKLLSSDMKKMKMAVKLFVVMGIPRLFESVSACTNPGPASGVAEVIIILFDTFNRLQGVFIFCIFILKVKFILALQKKLGVEYLRRSSQSTTSGTTGAGTTCSTVAATTV